MVPVSPLCQGTSWRACSGHLLRALLRAPLSAGLYRSSSPREAVCWALASLFWPHLLPSCSLPFLARAVLWMRQAPRVHRRALAGVCVGFQGKAVSPEIHAMAGTGRHLQGAGSRELRPCFLVPPFPKDCSRGRPLLSQGPTSLLREGPAAHPEGSVAVRADAVWAKDLQHFPRGMWSDPLE